MSVRLVAGASRGSAADRDARRALPPALRTRPARRWRERARAALGLWLGIGALGCDTGSFATAPPPPCREAGAQCPLADGPLGVCERAPCGPDATPPCFACTPQH